MSREQPARFANLRNRKPHPLLNPYVIALIAGGVGGALCFLLLCGVMA